MQTECNGCRYESTTGSAEPCISCINLDDKPNYESKEKVSNCCHAHIIYNDICGRCKEHCEPVNEE